MLTKKLSIFLVISFYFVTLSAQNDDIRFQRITINDGLSLSSVYTIYQDQKGFMWFGTEDGLNRFDGKNIVIFRPDISAKNTICYKWIEHIAEDTTGMLWFGSRVGLSGFDPKKEIFYNYRKTADSTSLTNDTITTLFIDKFNFAWVGTVNGLNRINPATLENQRIGCNKFPYVKSRINEIIESEGEEIWIASNSGLYKFSYNENKCLKIPISIEGIQIDKINSLAKTTNFLFAGTNKGLLEIDIKTLNCKLYTNKDISTGIADTSLIVEKALLDERKNLWLGCQKGLYRFNLQTKNTTQEVKTIDISHSLSINTIKPMHKDGEGNIWYGTFGNGLFKVQAKTGLISSYTYNPGSQTSLSENALNCIYEDSKGALWIGTFGAGINIYDPNTHKFQLLKNNPTNNNSLASNFVWTIFEDHNGNVWIGTNNKGITKYLPTEEKYLIFDHDPQNSNSLSAHSVRDIYEDSEGRIWAGTDGGGLNLFIPEKNQFKHYKNIVGDTTSISDNSIRVIYEDNKGILWIGTRNGLNRFNPETGKFKRYQHNTNNPTSISHNFIYATIHQDKNNKLWIGTYGGGLNIMDYKTENFICYQHSPENLNSLSDNIVFAIYEEPESDYFWIGTNNGLDRFNPYTNEFKRFGLEEGLPNEVVYSILPDSNNNIWLSTNLGICRFNLKTFETKNFDVNDGLQSNEFNGGAFHKGKSGKLYFGGVYGLNIINPEKLAPEPLLSRITITDFEVLGKKVFVEDNNNSQENRVIDNTKYFTISENISYTDEIIFDYKNSFFSLEFSALSDISSKKINYSYIMEGLEDNWFYTGSRNYVSYANITPGEYTFKVRAQNADGIWSKPSEGLRIIIKPPFWRTNWFYFLEFVIFLMVVYFVYVYLMRVKTNKLLTEQNKKINEFNQKLVTSEKNLKELNATKDKFFSIIAHDLKNPFTSLLSIGEVIHDNYKHLDDEEKHKGIKQIYDSSTNINRLLENLLTWSRSQSNRIKFEPVNFNLSKLIEETRLLYKTEAENKGIILRANYKEDMMVVGDRNMINTVIRNLVNNAIKFCNKEDTIDIILESQEKNYFITIKDTGIGIEKENLEKLFRIDRKFKTKGTAGENGTGLGLILCKEFIERNKGEITVESTAGVGSSFTISLPKNT